MKGGIYHIKNTVSNGIYFGRSVDVSDRLIHHKQQLKRNVHANKRLQHSWNKHGEQAFEFKMIWEETPDKLEELEGLVLETAWGSERLFNHHKLSAGGFMPNNKLGCFLRSEETKKKMSIAFTGREFSKQHKQNIAKVKAGLKASDDTKKKMSDARTGKPRPQSWHDKMAEYRANNPNPMQGKISPMRGKTFPTIACEHCGKEASKGNYNRWHGSKCKLKEHTWKSEQKQVK
jgi:group I intron endonuclease